MGGVINIVTKRDLSYGGEVQLSAGSNGRRQYLCNYSGTDGGRFGFSLYANKTQEDAWLRNSDYRDEQVGMGLSWKLNATDQLRFHIDHNDVKRGLVVANIPAAPDTAPRIRSLRSVMVLPAPATLRRPMAPMRKYIAIILRLPGIRSGKMGLTR